MITSRCHIIQRRPCVGNIAHACIPSSQTPHGSVGSVAPIVLNTRALAVRSERSSLQDNKMKPYQTKHNNARNIPPEPSLNARTSNCIAVEREAIQGSDGVASFLLKPESRSNEDEQSNRRDDQMHHQRLRRERDIHQVDRDYRQEGRNEVGRWLHVPNSSFRIGQRLRSKAPSGLMCGMRESPFQVPPGRRDLLPEDLAADFFSRMLHCSAASM